MWNVFFDFFLQVCEYPGAPNTFSGGISLVFQTLCENVVPGGPVTPLDLYHIYHQWFHRVTRQQRSLKSWLLQSMLHRKATKKHNKKKRKHYVQWDRLAQTWVEQTFSPFSLLLLFKKHWAFTNVRHVSLGPFAILDGTQSSECIGVCPVHGKDARLTCVVIRRAAPNSCKESECYCGPIQAVNAFTTTFFQAWAMQS